MQRSFCALLSALFVFVLCIPCAAVDTQIVKTREYSGFSDVAPGSWCDDAIRLCYECGLLNGTSATTFSPNGNLTEAQLLVLTARLYDLRQGGDGTIPPLPEHPEAYARFLDSSGSEAASLLDVEFSIGSSVSGFSTLTVTFPTLPMRKALTLQIGFPGDGIEATLTGHFVAGNTKQLGVLDGHPVYSVTEDHYEFPTENTIGAQRLCQALTAYQLSTDIFPEYWDKWYYPAVYDLSYREGVFPVWAPHAQTAGEANAPAWREDFATFLGSVCPDLTPLNAVDEIPDVNPDRYDYAQYAAIRTLYEAGILNGVDAQGSFHGTGTLSRAQAAVMLARVLQPSTRIGANAS